MAGSKSNYLQNKLLDHVLGGTAYSAPATHWIALFTSNTGLLTSSVSNEVSGGSYARVQVVSNTTNWPNATTVSGSGQKQNGASFTFPTATGSWGTVTSFAIIDSSSGSGNILYWGDLTVSKTISSGDTATFASSDITITET